MNTKWTKYKFNTFDELTEYWESNFDYFADNNLKTKVIGTTLYVFKGVKLE
mgnify:CR=1 FL=1